MTATRVKPGQRYGRLLVAEVERKEKGGAIIWKCLCDCGSISFPRSQTLTSGSAKSCGCAKKAASAKRLSEYWRGHADGYKKGQEEAARQIQRLEAQLRLAEAANQPQLDIRMRKLASTP
jgi:hypothetical protein